MLPPLHYSTPSTAGCIYYHCNLYWMVFEGGIIPVLVVDHQEVERVDNNQRAYIHRRLCVPVLVLVVIPMFYDGLPYHYGGGV